MIVLIDTNVAIDVLSDRMPFAEHSSAVLQLCETNVIKGFVTATTITDIYYILSKAVADTAKLYTILEKLLSVTELCDVTKQNIFNALKQRQYDFEDAVQSDCAATVGAEYIITRNTKDFINSKVMAITPKDFIANYFPNWEH